MNKSNKLCIGTQYLIESLWYFYDLSFSKHAFFYLFVQESEGQIQYLHMKGQGNIP